MKNVIIYGITMLVLMGGMLSGCSSIPDTDGDTTISCAWEKIMLEHGDYNICIETPGVFNNEPPTGIDWSTTYDNEDENLHVEIDFYFMDGSFKELRSRLETDGVVIQETNLWNCEVSYYLEKRIYVTDEDEIPKKDVVNVLIPLENDTYIQVDLYNKYETSLDGERLFKDEEFQESVLLEISKDYE